MSEKKQIFAISDVHGFANEMIDALHEAGFEENNSNHLLISCGDELDRGKQPLETIQYLDSLNNAILIKGNHTWLFQELCDKNYPEEYDWDNGTVDSVLALGHYKYGDSFAQCALRAYITTYNFFQKFVHYYQTKNYTFVHSFVPLIIEDDLPMYYTKNRKFKWNRNWEKASDSEWEKASWGNPFELAEQFWIDQPTTLVFGHWGTENKWAEVEGRTPFKGSFINNDIFYGNNYIGLDTTTSISRKVNVLKIEDELL